MDIAIGIEIAKYLISLGIEHGDDVYDAVKSWSKDEITLDDLKELGYFVPGDVDKYFGEAD
jgi:hypothetical protein